MLEKVRLAEPFAVLDVIVHGLAKVEPIGGGLYRFTFFSELDGEWIVAARLVAASENVPPAIMKAAAEFGLCVLKSGMSVH